MRCSGMEQYHIDGPSCRCCGFHALYLDYGRENGQWVPRVNTEQIKNLEAIEFFKHLNTVVLGRNKGTVVMIAEESTAWPKVTAHPEEGGFRVQLKMGIWDGCMISSEYMKSRSVFPSNTIHHKMTVSLFDLRIQ